METSTRGAEAGPPAGALLHDERIVALYRRGQSLRTVGAACGVSRQTALNVLRARGVQRRAAGPPPAPVPEAAEIRRRYAAGASLADLRRAYPYGDVRLRWVLREGGLPLRPPVGSKRRFSAAEEAAICANYQAGDSIRALARQLGCNGMTVHRLLVRHGVPRRPPQRPRSGA